MTLMPSTMPGLGIPAPDFTLPNTNEEAGTSLVKLDDFAASQALLVAFWCNHCPYVIHVREGFADFAREYQSRGLAVVAIGANDVKTHPADNPDRMKEAARQFGYTFPYLYDESQQVAKAYDAACTPDFFLYDEHHKLVYRGQFDASRPGNSEPVTGHDMRRAVDAVLAGQPVTGEQLPSIGCNIKWQPGNEPGQ